MKHMANVLSVDEMKQRRTFDLLQHLYEEGVVDFSYGNCLL